MAKHASHGASSAHRWMACPGSIRLSEGIEDRPSADAAEGTAAHKVAELCLSGDRDAIELIDRRIEGHVVDAEMAEHVQTYLDVIRTERGDTGMLGIEMEVDVGKWLKAPVPMFGTADAVVVDDNCDTLKVGDLKYGAGVVVEARGNPQPRYYALGALIGLGWPSHINQVETIIVQPRAPHPDSPVRREVLDVVELIAWSGELLGAVHATLAEDAPLVPGSHCRFCPAKTVCPALRDQALTLAQEEFGGSGPPQPVDLTPEEIGRYLDAAEQVEDWIRALRDHAHGRLEAGDAVPGWKLVKKRATRKWRDPDGAAVELLTEHGLSIEAVYDQKLRSPAQVEKALPKEQRKELKPLIVSESSGTTMARDADSRLAIAAGPSADFTSVEETQNHG